MEEEQIVKTFIQKWIVALFDEQFCKYVDGDQKRMLYELFQTNQWRIVFLQCLLEKSNEHVVLHQWNFELLVDMIRTILEKANKENNFQFLSIVLQLISKYFTLQLNGLSVFLQDYLIDLDIWNNDNFWKIVFSEIIEKHNQNITDLFAETDGKHKILKSFIYYMIILKVNEKLIFVLIMDICSHFQLQVHESVLNSLIEDMKNIILITEQIGDRYDQRKNFFTPVSYDKKDYNYLKKSLYYQIATNAKTKIFNGTIFHNFFLPKKCLQFAITKELKNKYSVTSIKMMSPINKMQYHHILKVIICGTDDGQILIYNYKNKVPVTSFYNCKDCVNCLAIDEQVSFFVSGSEDNTVRVWNVKEDGKWFQQNLFYDHTKKIDCVALKNTYVVSGSLDKCLKVFDLQSNLCIGTLNGHDDCISCVHLQNNENNLQIVSGAFNGSICVWDSRTWQAIHNFNHNSDVLQVQFVSDKIVSASFDKTLKMWNTISGKCEQEYIGHDHSVNCFQYSGNKLVSGSLDNTLKVWDFETGGCLQTMNGHTDTVFCLKIFDNKVISGSKDTSIKIWDIKTGSCITTLLEHNGSVNNVEIEENCIISCSSDRFLKFWEFENGDFCLNS